jgi:FkbM family methyltransferase
MSTYQLSECKYGRFLYNRNDTYIGRSLEYYGEWSDFELDLFRQVLRPGDHVVETGSNIGSHTVAIGQMVGEDGVVHSFEPMRYTHQLLDANLALNECFNVFSHNAATGRESTKIQFPHIDPRSVANFGALAIENPLALPTEAVDMVAIDSLDLQRLDFLKADIEGHELDMLIGAQQTIARCRPTIYVEFGPSKDELVAQFDAMGYNCYYFISPMYNPGNFRGHAVDIFGASSMDLLCMPKERDKVSGLSAARVGDQLVTFNGATAVYATLPWTGARV